MDFVGIIVPFGHTHVTTHHVGTRDYPLPVQLGDPCLWFDHMPLPSELPAYFDSIEADLKASYESRGIVPIPGLNDYQLSDYIHLTYVQLDVFEGLQPGAEREVWHRMMHLTEGTVLDTLCFNRHGALDVIRR